MDTISIYATHKIDVYRHFTDILYLYYTEKSHLPISWQMTFVELRVHSYPINVLIL